MNAHSNINEARTPPALPPHLEKYVVDQNYNRYTPEDQAVWRFIMRQLKASLATTAHPCYSEGLAKTGINVEQIPQITDMDAKLQNFGWRAVPVSGFIPPAAFMEFQSLGYLPIASDMRTIDHLLYTPAPDIVHEAAGHAPILTDPAFAQYLRAYADVARHAILSQEDLQQYAAIRDLSDLKENPSSTAAQILAAEENLHVINQNIPFISEGALLSRLNWWTVEYGLIGSLESPRLFGAGLLSSLGESRECLKPHIQKLPLSIDCILYAYDITEPQPQLFVTPDFQFLQTVLEQLAEKMAFRQGGLVGLETSFKARTVNTVCLNSGLQISGVLSQIFAQPRQPFDYLQFSGACQLAVSNNELPGHGVTTHPHGYGTPVGLLAGMDKCLSSLSAEQLRQLGIVPQRKCSLHYQSGVCVDGTVVDSLQKNGSTVLISFENCRVTRDKQVLFDPEWGRFDLGVGATVPSVFGGPADRTRYDNPHSMNAIRQDFTLQKVPAKNYSLEQQRQHGVYKELRRLRELHRKNFDSKRDSDLATQIEVLSQTYLSELASSWLIGIELLEWSYSMPSLEKLQAALLTQLRAWATPATRECIEQGIQLACCGI